MTSDVVGKGSVGEVRYQAVQWVFVGPCVVRYCVGDIVSSQIGWGNS